MTIGSAILSIVSGLLAGGVVNNIVAPPQVDAGALPIDKILATGAGGLVMFTMWLWMERDRKQQALHADAMKAERDQHSKLLVAHVEAGQKVAADFSTTATTITRTFADATKAADERAERRESDLRQLLHNFTKDRP